MFERKGSVHKQIQTVVVFVQLRPDQPLPCADFIPGRRSHALFSKVPRLGFRHGIGLVGHGPLDQQPYLAIGPRAIRRGRPHLLYP